MEGEVVKGLANINKNERGALAQEHAIEGILDSRALDIAEIFRRGASFVMMNTVPKIDPCKGHKDFVRIAERDLVLAIKPRL